MAKKTKTAALQDLLFEIGCEELPATSLADIFESASPAENAFAEKLKKLLTEKRLSFKTCQVWATPRRLVFYATEVSSEQEARDQMTKIFAKEEAYSPDGSPTEKFLNILKHRNASMDDIVIQDLSGKPFAFIRKAESCEKTSKILPGIFEALVKTLNFPKNMKWDDSGILFSRPIRHYLAIFGKQTLKFKIGCTSSIAGTVIFLKGKRIRAAVKDIPSYFKALQKQGVILDQAQRKKMIEGELAQLAASMKLRLYEDPFLLNEVNYLVEIPHALAAPFGDEFLSLPLEVLAVSMARKQRIFGLINQAGSLAPKLVAVLDGTRTAAEKKVISKNIENILHAKLQDSLFFYREDIKINLEKKRDELKNLVFLKGAGSMLEKTKRLDNLSELIGSVVFTSEEVRLLKRASILSKSDLLAQMVGEFPELQGIMGKYYAIANGESDIVARAIGEQYLPRTTNDKLPGTKIGCLLSILDKADLIAACFALGLEPTSSLDPYGLRRSVSAILKILVGEKGFDLPLTILISQTCGQLQLVIKNIDLDKTEKKLLNFFKDRFIALMVDEGYPEALVNAVVSSNFDNPREIRNRLQALRNHKDLPRAQKIVERTANILRNNKDVFPNTIDPTVFTEPIEHLVFQKYQEFSPRIVKAKEVQDYGTATSLYAEAFFDILGEFFEKVFINTEDTKVRTNRLLLLKTIKELYTQNIAELSKIRL